MREIHGVLHAYFETGTEGVYWTLIEDGMSGHHKLHFIEDGDRLTIFGDDDRAIFDDCIKQDTTTRIESRPFNPEFKQQVALGLWVHWIQAGWEPDNWAQFFVSDNVRAKLVKNNA